MSFDLKDVRAAYQRSMNLIFHELIDKSVEVYIDDVVVKSVDVTAHVVDIRQAFAKMRHHGLKMNPAKYMFGVSVWNFFGFIVHNQSYRWIKTKSKLC